MSVFMRMYVVGCVCIYGRNERVYICAMRECVVWWGGWWCGGAVRGGGSNARLTSERQGSLAI